MTESNQGDFFVRLERRRERGTAQVMDEVRGRIVRDVPGLEIEVAQLMEDLIGDLTAVPQPIEIEVFSEDPQVLNSTAQRVAGAFELATAKLGG